MFKTYDKIANSADTLANLTVNALQIFEERDSPEFLCRSTATKTDTIIFSAFILQTMCIYPFDNEIAAAEFSNRYIGAVQTALRKMNYLNPSFDTIFKDRIAFYERISSMQQDIEDKISAVTDQFHMIIKNDIIRNKLFSFSDSCPPFVEGIKFDDAFCSHEEKNYLYFIISHADKCLDVVIDAINSSIGQTSSENQEDIITHFPPETACINSYKTKDIPSKDVDVSVSKPKFSFLDIAKEKLVNWLGTFGYILYFALSIFLAYFPFIFLNFGFWIECLVILAILWLPLIGTIVNAVIWIWALVVCIQGPQDIFAIIYYVLFVFNFFPYVRAFFSLFGSRRDY